MWNCDWLEYERKNFDFSSSFQTLWEPENSVLKASVFLLQVFVCVLVCAAYASAGFLGGGDGGYSGGGGGGWQSGEIFYVINLNDRKAKKNAKTQAISWAFLKTRSSFSFLLNIWKIFSWNTFDFLLIRRFIKLSTNYLSLSRWKVELVES